MKLSKQRSQKQRVNFSTFTFVAASCHLPLHTSNRSLFVWGLSIDSLAYVTSQHARWPIRTPRPTCANQDAWAVITPRWPKANSIHTATRHAWTRTPARNTAQKAVFSLIHCPASFIRLWPSCHFDLGGIQTWFGAVCRTTLQFLPLKTNGKKGWY